MEFLKESPPPKFLEEFLHKSPKDLPQESLKSLKKSFKAFQKKKILMEFLEKTVKKFPKKLFEKFLNEFHKKHLQELRDLHLTPIFQEMP